MSRRDSSDEGSHHMVSMRNKKIIIKYCLLSRALISCYISGQLEADNEKLCAKEPCLLLTKNPEANG